MEGEMLVVMRCTVLGCTCASLTPTGPIDVIVVSLLTEQGDTLSLAFTQPETQRLFNVILERIGVEE